MAHSSTVSSRPALASIVDAIGRLSPSDIENLLATIHRVRGQREALAEIEARTDREHICRNCGAAQRQKWGTTRTGVQRYRCAKCGKTASGLSKSGIARVHRHDLFLEAVRNMMSDRPLSCRKLGKRLALSKDTIWRWRLRILEALGKASDQSFTGIVEADETHQRESRKGSREWVNHERNPATYPEPNRRPWYEYTSGRMKMKRGLSRFQLPILTVMDRSGQLLFERIKNRSVPVIEAALRDLVAPDVVLCSDGAAAYAKFCSKRGHPHYVLGRNPGTRVIEGAFHIQTVNSVHSRYSAFIRPLCGPASKYLDHYLTWFLTQSKMTAIEVFRRVLDSEVL